MPRGLPEVSRDDVKQFAEGVPARAPRPAPRAGAPYGPNDSRVVDVAVPERFAEAVRGFVRWLEAGPNPSALRHSKKGKQITARLELSGEPERVMAQAREAGGWI